MTKKNAIKEVCKKFNLSLECVVVQMEYTGHYSRDWHALILQHFESDTSYLIEYDNVSNECSIKQYKGTDNENRLTDLYEFIIA